MAQGMDEFIPRGEPGSGVPVAYECAITTDGVNDPSDQVDAKEISEDGNGFVHEDCRWEPRLNADGSVRYPDRGDRALIIISDDKEPWIVSWTPYG